MAAVANSHLKTMFIRIFTVLLVFAATRTAAETAAASTRQKLSKAGGAGHALLFQNHIAKVPAFKGFPADAITFEAWVSTTDFCHSGTLVSYAKMVESHDESVRNAAANHFVIFDSLNLIACHDFSTLSGAPDSCANAFVPNKTGSVVTRDGSWRHVAVTWNGKKDGLTNVYVDGSLMASAITKKTEPLEANGVLLLGQEQDCLGGCTDATQSFQGMMDEVRIWRVERTQDEIARFMRWTDGLEKDKDLVAYWKFNDPDSDGGNWRAHAVARDASGTGNDLVLVDFPKQFTVDINGLKTGAMAFKGQFAHSWTTLMPKEDFTIEFWARANSLTTVSGQEQYNTILDYATRTGEAGQVGSMDDAIRIERYSFEYKKKLSLNHSTVGAVGLHINTNWDTTQTGGKAGTGTRWIDFLADWVDDKWHHIAVTWKFETGEAKLYFDGQEKPAFWRRTDGAEETWDAPEFKPIVAPKIKRADVGSLVLGMDQDCFGGCINPSTPGNVDMSVLRVWKTVLTAKQIQRNMYHEAPVDGDGLLFYFNFPKPSDPDDSWLESSAQAQVLDPMVPAPIFFMYSPAPNFVYSTAPLTTSDGRPVLAPQPGQAGHALSISDQQVIVAHNFKNFPSIAITVEFWMRSVDTCRQGVPISYATGEYSKGDNSFLIFNYNSLGVAVMEDQGTAGYDTNSGVTVTDGQWHHICVTWESATGRTNMFVDTNLVWSGTRAQGKAIPPGGTLVIGREQDCLGGCFDSLAGAAGSYDSDTANEYGPQDFTGAIEQMRIWDTVRSYDEILTSYADDALQRKMGSDHKNLVAHWEFDEGAGYRVEDLTRHGNDLVILSNPKFEVVKWLGVCGNAILEGDEECDLGANGPNTGCTDKCKLEAGWYCEDERKVCFKVDGQNVESPSGSRPAPKPSTSSSSSSHTSQMPAHSTMMNSPGKKSSQGSFWGVLLGVVAAVSVLGVLGYVGRDALYEHIWLKFRPQQRYHSMNVEYDLAEPPRAMMPRDLQPDYFPLAQGPQGGTGTV